MPSDAKKKRDAKKKEEAKKRGQKKGAKDETEVNGEGDEADTTENGYGETNGSSGKLVYFLMYS
jgi:hypothetical protein